MTAGWVLAILRSCGEPCSGETEGRGRIAQLGERFPYKEEVTGSSPVSPTIGSTKHMVPSTKTKNQRRLGQDDANDSVRSGLCALYLRTLYFKYTWGCSSVGLERLPVTQEAAGSSPVIPASLRVPSTKYRVQRHQAGCSVIRRGGSLYLVLCTLCGAGIAQLVEQWTENPRVRSSTLRPGTITSYIKQSAIPGAFAPLSLGPGNREPT